MQIATMVQNRYESDEADVSKLGQPLEFTFSGRTAPNRFMKAAMTERLSSWDPKNFHARGIPSKNLINVYRRWGEGEYGVILSGNLMIDYDQLEAMGNAIIPLEAQTSGERFEAFKEMGAAAKAHGSLIVGQVSHPGRQVEDRINKHPISASDVQLEGDIMGMHFAKPRSATQEDIDKVIEGFAHSAEYLEKAGWDGIELHAAHGYLLAQFLAPSTNQRTDKYGGSLENRGRLISEIGQAVRKRTSKSFILGIKLNSVEFQDKGFTPEDAKDLCTYLEKDGFDFVELSGGTYESMAFVHKRESTKKREGFFLEFADKIAPGLKRTKTYVCGGLRTSGAMVKALDHVDGVSLARPTTQEPRLSKEMLEGKIRAGAKPELDTENFGLTNVVAGSQIRQIGKDHEPIDMTVRENVELFMKDMGAWGEKMSKDSELINYGYVDIDSAQPKPYGVA